MNYYYYYVLLFNEYDLLLNFFLYLDVALIKNNAKTAAEIAVKLEELKRNIVLNHEVGRPVSK